MFYVTNQEETEEKSILELEKLVISYLLKLLNFSNPLITIRLEKSVYQHSFYLSVLSVCRFDKRTIRQLRRSRQATIH